MFTYSQHDGGPPRSRARLGLLALGIATSGILMTPSLPVVGTKLALPDLPLLSLVVLTVAMALRQPMYITSEIRLILLAAALFLWHASFSAVWSTLHESGINVAITLANYLYGAAIMFATMAAVRSFSDLEFLFKAWMVGWLLVAGIAVLAFAGFGPEWAYQGSRIKSTLRGVNQMQSYLTPVLAIAIFVFFFEGKSKRLSVFLAVLIPLTAVALLSTGSRSSFLFFASKSMLPLPLRLLLQLLQSELT